MKKVMAMLLAAMMVLSLVACGNSTSSSTPGANTPNSGAQSDADTTGKESYTFAISVATLANDFWVRWTGQLQADCDADGNKLIIHDAQGDVAAQISAMENWIMQDVDCIILAAVDTEALSPVVDEAMEAGIPVIVAGVKTHNYTAHVGVIQKEFGKTTGEYAAAWINENLGDKEVVNIAVLDKPTEVNLVERTDALVEALLANAPNVEIVAREAAQTADEGVTAAEIILQAHPDLDGIVSIGDTALLGAYEAVISSGMDTTNMVLIGCDGDPKALQLIAEGTCYRATNLINVEASGHLNYLQCLAAARGETVEDAVSVVTPVTIDNVADWLK